MKLKEITSLIGEIIESYKISDGKYSIELFTESGKTFVIELEDEGGGCDSHASIGKVELSDVIGKTIAEAYEESKDSSQAVLIFKTRGKRIGRIELDHEHNGYYNFSYDISEYIKLNHGLI